MQQLPFSRPRTKNTIFGITIIDFNCKICCRRSFRPYGCFKSCICNQSFGLFKIHRRAVLVAIKCSYFDYQISCMSVGNLSNLFSMTPSMSFMILKTGVAHLTYTCIRTLRNRQCALVFIDCRRRCAIGIQSLYYVTITIPLSNFGLPNPFRCIRWFSRIAPDIEIKCRGIGGSLIIIKPGIGFNRSPINTIYCPIFIRGSNCTFSGIILFNYLHSHLG